MTDFNAAAVTHVLSTAGEIIIASKRIPLSLVDSRCSRSLGRGTTRPMQSIRRLPSTAYSMRAGCYVDQIGHTLQSVDVTPAVSPSSQPTLWRTCRVLANRKRLQTLAILIRQPNQTVSAVAERMSLSMPAASQYLRALEARGLLTCRRVGRRVEYRPAAMTSEGAAEEIVRALRLVFRRRAQPIEAIFKLATGFTHPRRIEVFRALTNGADSFAKLQAATNMPARALSRHLAKLEARGFVKNEMALCVATIQRHPFGRVLARLARR